MTACDGCLRRTALLAALAGWIDVEWRARSGRPLLLALPDAELLSAAGRHGAAAARDYRRFDAAAARACAAAAGLVVVCGCAPGYPERLRDLPDPPSVLHVRGDPAALHAPDAVAIVGARRGSDYGIDIARTLGRDLSVAGVPIVSGLALGVDAAAHAGATEGVARPVAVLATGADRCYPPSSQRLYERVATMGAVVSELPPGSPVRRWAFPARNRIIAALAHVTVVVEATEHSGSLITADLANDLGRTVGAVPGRVTSRFAAGANGLLATGAAVVRGAGDVLDLLAADGFTLERPALGPPAGPDLHPRLRALLDGVEQGRGSVAELAASQHEVDDVLRGLTELESRGLIRREFGGSYRRCA